MNTGTPYATYRKTTPSKVFVQILNPFNLQAQGLILYGDPKKAETARIDVWTEMEDQFFKRSNRKHLELGTIIRFERVPVEEVKTIEQYSDIELREVLSHKYLPLQKILSEMKSVAVAYRLLEIAKEMEKSDKIIRAIEAKLAELQAPQLKE